MPRRGWVLSLLSVALLGATLVVAPPASAADPQESPGVRLVSRTPDGDYPNNTSAIPVISDDGSTVVFQSQATDLVPGVTGPHLYAADVETGAIVVVDDGPTSHWPLGLTDDGGQVLWSRAPGSAILTDTATGAHDEVALPGGGDTNARAMSDDGRRILYVEAEVDVFGNPRPGPWFVLDRPSGVALPVATRPDGTQATQVFSPTLTADGATVVFTSPDEQLAPLPEGHWGLFRQRLGGVLELLGSGPQVNYVLDLDDHGDVVVATPLLVGPNGPFTVDGSPTALSDDGRSLLLHRQAPNGAWNLYVQDLVSGAAVLANVDADGQPVGAVGTHGFSGNGRVVLFESEAAGVVPGLGAGRRMYARDIEAGTTTVVCCEPSSPAEAGWVGLDDSGTRVTFQHRGHRGTSYWSGGDIYLWSLDGPRLIVGSVTAVEGDGAVRVPVTLEEPLADDLRLRWSTGPGWSSTDLAGTPGELVIPAGTTAATIELAVLDDGVHEATETYTVRVSGADQVVPGRTSGQITIEDDDPGIGVVAEPATAGEADGVLTWTVALDAPSGAPVSLRWEVGEDPEAPTWFGAGEGTDFTAATGALVLAPGETSRTVVVPVLADELHEHEERLHLTLSDVEGATLLTPTVAGTLFDDDRAPFLDGADVTVAEDAGSVTLALTLDRPSAVPVTGTWRTLDGQGSLQATAGADFVGADGSFTIAPGALSTTVSVELLDDELVEDRERLLVVLDRVEGAWSWRHPGAFLEDDEPRPIVSAESAQVIEGEGALVFTLRLDRPSGGWTAVSWQAVESGVAPDQRARAGQDFTSRSGSVTLAPGTTLATVSVPVLDDEVSERPEQFQLALVGASGATVGTPWVTGTIVDDDPVPVVSVADTKVAEPGGRMTWTVRLDRPSGTPVTIGWRAYQDTSAPDDREARDQVDFNGAGGTLTFAPGATSATVSAVVRNDALFERDEWFVVQLLSPSGATLGRATAVGVINDDESGSLWELLR